MSLNKSITAPLHFLWSLGVVYFCYMLCRMVFVAENWREYSDTLFLNTWSDLLNGSLLFDTSAILYTNSLFALLMLFPFQIRDSKAWQTVARTLFIVVNSLCISINLADAVYFQFTGRRTTMSVLSEFSNEGNIGSIIGVELMRHWYIVLAGIAIIFVLVTLTSRRFMPARCLSLGRWGGVVNILFLLIFVPLAVAGMRGGMTTAVRPITISNANQYVNRPAEAAVVLNTPFSIIRTINKVSYTDPGYFTTEELDALYSPLRMRPEGIHLPDSLVCDTVNAVKRRNVVILIVESFSREFIGAYNERITSPDYQSYTPFVDSLYQHCLSFDYTFSNGRKSIDGMPSILSSIPMFIEPFILTPSSMNRISSIAGELGSVGYESAFFHGAENGSMGFQAYARASGFKHYYGRTEYEADSRFGGSADFDGTWAIWDEPFLQFYAASMNELKQPFITSVFTASSHHPFRVPHKYKDVFKDEDDNVLHKCIRYTDFAIRRFFETARQQPWFENTVFVLTSDHTNHSSYVEYQTDLGLFGSPILIYDPQGDIRPGRRHTVAQQIDIMPSLLSYLGYDKPYVAFGKDVFLTPDSACWAVNYNNGIYQYVRDGYLLQFDGTAVRSLYNIDEDWMLRNNLLGALPERQTMMEREVKAIIQSYMQRMSTDRLVVKE